MAWCDPIMSTYLAQGVGTLGGNFQCWKSKGNAQRHHQIVFLEGIKKNRKLKVISTVAWICYHPSSWDWCTLLLSLIIYDQTSSPKLDKVLKKWEQEKWASAKNWQKLAYIILVELLAYQFASPVHWIQTQDLLFTTFNFEHLVELGPLPTLTGMATRTLKTKYETLDEWNRQGHLLIVLWIWLWTFHWQMDTIYPGCGRPGTFKGGKFDPLEQNTFIRRNSMTTFGKSL